jgi:hypothetical protein
LGGLFDFENRQNPGGSYFPDVDSRFKFCTLVFGGEKRTFAASRCAFYLHDIAELDDPARVLELSAEDFRRVNPNTGAAPIFRDRRDAGITMKIYREHPVLVDRSGDSERKVWPVKYVTMFHMTNDSHLFLTRDEVAKQGGEAVPLYVGRMIHQYDHRFASVTVNEANLHNAAFGAALSAREKADPALAPVPQYWVRPDAVPEDLRRPWALGFRDIARATDVRTTIAAIVPGMAAGNTLPLLDGLSAPAASLLLANLNSLAFDFIARQKAQSTHLNWYILEQLPVIAPERFEEKIGKTKIADFIREQVLHLTYTAHDMAPFARDLGFAGPPFEWNEADRRTRMVALDALFMYLYGIDDDDAGWILDSFPIVRAQDEAEFGDYRIKSRILAALKAIREGRLLV